MATTQATEPDPSSSDAEHLQHLYRGGELLAAGKVIEAKDFLERAHKLQPKNEKGQNLLGLTYFKLGLFDRAAEIYEMLVRENPVDPTLRVNLGLVYLKTGALQRAVREFEVAVDMAPDHKKAHNYLGLALAQQGEYGRAREHFLLAGSEAMAEKMSRAIAGEGFSRPEPVQPAQERGFAELEGADVVREQGGEPVEETRPAPRAQAAPEPSEEWVVESRASLGAQEVAEQGGHGAQAPVEEAEPDIEVVEEAPLPQGAQPATPVLPTPPQVPLPRQALPPAEDDWGAQFGFEDAEQPSEAVEAQASAPESRAEAQESPEGEPPAPESELSGAEGPVMVVTAPEAEPSEDVSITVEEEPAPAAVEAAPPPPPPEEAELPIMSVEEVSVEEVSPPPPPREEAEELAIEARHEQAPAPSAAVAPPPPPPEEVPSEALASRPSPSEEARPAAAPAAPGPGAAGEVRRVPVLGELAPTLALESASEQSPFRVSAEGFSARVDGELLTRLDGLVAMQGQLSFQPEMKRFRGRTTDKPFGEAAGRVVRASGQGTLYVGVGEERVFQAVDLGEESAYFRDECVFAFEEPVSFENGRVPSEVAPDLDLVHLRGDGKVVLRLGGPLRSVRVSMEGPVTVPLERLVGWQGNLTPRVVALLHGAGGEILKTGVELSGEGFALLCLPVR